MEVMWSISMVALVSINARQIKMCLLYNISYIAPLNVYGNNKAFGTIEYMNKKIPKRDKIIIINPYLIIRGMLPAQSQFMVRITAAGQEKGGR